MSGIIFNLVPTQYILKLSKKKNNAKQQDTTIKKTPHLSHSSAEQI